jgi:hypothetical protein
VWLGCSRPQILVALRGMAKASVLPCHEHQITALDLRASIMGAKIRAQSAREAAKKAARDADRAEAQAWSIQMEGYGGPAQPSPTIRQCLNGRLGWLQVKCRRCETEVSIPLEHVRWPRDTPIWKLESSLKCRLAEVGVKWNVQRGCRPSHAITLVCLWVA